MKTLKRIGYIFANNFVMDAIKDMGQLLKFSFEGWQKLGKLWSDIFGDSFFTMVLKGWKMIFSVITNGWKIQMTIINDIEGIFKRSINNIGITFQQMFNKVKDANPFMDFDSKTANAALETQREAVFGSQTRKAWEKLNEDIFSINMGLDVGQRNANYRLDTSNINLAGGTAAGIGMLGTTGGVVDEVTTIEKDNAVKESLYIDEEIERNREIARRRIDQIDKDEKYAEEQRQKMLSLATESINSVRSIVGIVGNESLNAFGKVTGSIGAASGLINAFAPGVGSLIGAGAGLLGDLFGQADQEETSSSSISELSSAASSRPSATITKSGPDTVYNNNYLTVQTGYYMGDEQSTRDLSQLIGDNIKNLSMGTI